jgi:hypothetical protein
MKCILCKLQFLCHLGKHMVNPIENDSSDWICQISASPISMVIDRKHQKVLKNI